MPASPLPEGIFALTGRPYTRLLRTVPVGGGSINSCSRLETDAGFFFLKENGAKKFPGMFEAEQRGLQLLAQTNAFVLPHVYGTLTENDRAFLLMEWLEQTPPAKAGWWEAGAALAKLHRQSVKTFGLDHDNYIGSLPQSNRMHATWAEFFVLERILPQVKLARDEGKLDVATVKAAEKCCARIGELFPVQPPALLHGDLWSGNFFFSAKGPALVDPAVHYGHREMDLAMTKLFGGFDADFYAGYANAFPLGKSWERRTDFCNLYPLLVHVNLFGGGYLYDVKRILSVF